MAGLRARSLRRGARVGTGSWRSSTLRRLAQLGLHELKNGRLRLLNTRALARIAEYYVTPPRLMPLL